MTRGRDIPLRYLAEINPPTPEIARLAPHELVTYLPLEAIWPDDRLDVTRVRAIGEGVGSYNVVREGDIVFPRVTPSFEHNRVAVARGLTNGLALASTEVHVVRPSAVELTELLHYRLRAADFQARGRADMVGVAGLRRIPERTVGTLTVPHHAIRHATETVAFLAERVSGISRLHRQLAALELHVAEARNALIEEAAGAASGPSVPLWSAVDVTRPVMYGIVQPGPHMPGGVPLIKGGDVEAERLDPQSLNCTSVEIDEKHARSRVAEGDVLVTIRGSFGATALVTPELVGANITQDTARITPAPGVLSLWVLYALRAPSAQAHLRSLATGASIRGVNIRDLKRIRIPLPQLGQQELAVQKLQSRLGKLDDLENRASRMRSLLHVYRDSLITEQFTALPQRTLRQRHVARAAGENATREPSLVG